MGNNCKNGSGIQTVGSTLKDWAFGFLFQEKFSYSCPFPYCVWYQGLENSDWLIFYLEVQLKCIPSLTISWGTSFYQQLQNIICAPHYWLYDMISRAHITGDQAFIVFLISSLLSCVDDDLKLQGVRICNGLNINRLIIIKDTVRFLCYVISPLNMNFISSIYPSTQMDCNIRHKNISCIVINMCFLTFRTSGGKMMYSWAWYMLHSLFPL